MNNRFGTMEEDAERRDFTFNALYYSPIDGQLIDWVGGLPDIRHRRLRTLGRAEASFAEDPVRMIRAVKYASLLDFPVPIAMAGLIRRMRESVLTCSRERVTEEVYKILSCGSAEAILELSHRLRLFEVIFPALAAQLQESRSRFPESPVGRRLEGLDERTREGTALDRAHMFGFLFGELAAARPELLADPDADSLIQGFIRTASAPLFPSKKDLAVAAAGLLKETQLRRRPRHGQPTPARHGPERAAKREGEARTGKTRRRGGRRRRRGGAGGTPAPPL
jgi:poly(A) polymerase